MTADTLSWRKAVSVSCAVHLLVGLCFGAAVQSWPQPEKKELEIAVELAMEEAAPEAEESLGGAPRLAAPGPLGGAETPERAESTRSVRPVAMPGEPISVATSVATPAQSEGVDSGDSAVPALAGAGGSGGLPSSAGGGGNGGGYAGASGSGSAAGAGGSGGGNGRAAAINGFVARVEAHKKYPYMALKRNLEGRPVVFVELDASGELAALSLSASCGVESLDKAALEAVRGACPYRHGLGAALAMEVPVQYRLSGG